MFPFVYDFRWDTTSLVFLGTFFSVVAVVALMVTAASLRSLKNLRGRKIEAIRWHDMFEDLPAPARACRFSISGSARGRVCHNSFECGGCQMFPHLRAWEQHHRDQHEEVDIRSLGFNLHDDRLYHRGHTWVRQEEDGTCLIGLDDFAKRLLGPTPSIHLPPVGSTLELHGVAFTVQSGISTVRVISPMEGEVIEIGSSEQDWLMRVRPAEEPADTKHLLDGRDARRWIEFEMERLHQLIENPGVGATLADGGTPVEDFSEMRPGTDWDGVLGMMMLDV